MERSAPGPSALTRQMLDAEERRGRAVAAVGIKQVNEALRTLADAVDRRLSEEINQMRAEIDARQLQNERELNKRFASMETEMRAIVGRRSERAVADLSGSFFLASGGTRTRS